MSATSVSQFRAGNEPATASTSTTDTPAATAEDDLVRLPRRRVDHLLIGMGVVAAIVFALAGGLLLWGSNFAGDYVEDELSSQNVFFPDAAALREEGRDDLVKYADEQVTTGQEAEAYAGYIAGHMEGIADGKTYSQIDDRGAAEAVTAAEEAGAPQAEIDELQATADQLKGQRDSLFRGETLRGLLLTSYAWDTIGMVAGIAAIVAFAGAGVMMALVIAGLVHLRRTH